LAISGYFLQAEFGVRSVGLAPIYLVDDCQEISAIASKRHRQSAGTGTLFLPGTTTTLGMRSFAVAGPHIWNSLPAALRTAMLSPLAFARHLKTHLFDGTDSMSEDYLGRALQICASSSTSSSVGRLVCPLVMVTNVYCGKTADSIEMSFGVVGRVDPRNYIILDGGPNSLRE